MDLPKFKYHPDPAKTLVIEKSKKKCVCCGQARGYIYTGPVYSIDELEDSICPWCIADGSAHEKFDASFTDESGIGGGGEWDDVPEEVVEEVAFRTPGFNGWQQERWWTHCGDAAEYLGPAGHQEALEAGEEFVQFLRDSTGIQSDQQWNKFFKALFAFSGPTAYIFRCRKCGKLGGYTDCM